MNVKDGFSRYVNAQVHEDFIHFLKNVLFCVVFYGKKFIIRHSIYGTLTIEHHRNSINTCHLYTTRRVSKYSTSKQPVPKLSFSCVFFAHSKCDVLMTA